MHPNLPDVGEVCDCRSQGQSVVNGLGSVSRKSYKDCPIPPFQQGQRFSRISHAIPRHPLPLPPSQRGCQAVKQTWEADSQRAGPRPPVQPKVSPPTVVDVMFRPQFEIPLQFLYGIPELRSPRRHCRGEEIPIPQVFGTQSAQSPFASW
jgi:hypothetical protein